MVDDQEGVREPLGMSGNRLEVNVHVITGAVTSAQNIIKSVNRAGLDVVDIILQPLASSEAVLSAEERELGVAMVDLGGGTTDLAIFLDGSIRHTAVLPIGGQNLTKDLAIGLLTSQTEAERIKVQHGMAQNGSDPRSSNGGSAFGRRPAAPDLFSKRYRRDSRAASGGNVRSGQAGNRPSRL